MIARSLTKGYRSTDPNRWEEGVSIATLVAAWMLQGLRVTYGIDFNDEMQYYGQIQSLLDSHSLFSSDLFIQQVVYILFFPLFKLHRMLLGESSLILFGRLVFACVVMLVYGASRRAFIRRGADSTSASLCALCLTLAIPIYNIYAISYNTIALALIALQLANFVRFRAAVTPLQLVAWAAISAAALLTHPPVGAVVATLTAVFILLEEKPQTALRYLLILAAGAGLGGCLLLGFTSVEKLRAAIEFSRAFSIDRPVDQATVRALLVLSSICVIGAILPSIPLVKLTQKASSELSLLAIGLSICAMVYVITRAINQQVWDASLTLAGWGVLLAGLSNLPTEKGLFRWIVLVFFTVSSTMALSSSNGIKQAYGMALLTSGFLCAIVAVGTRNRGIRAKLIGRIYLTGLLLGSLCVWLANPYRDEFLWRQTQRVSDVPAFRYIGMSEAKALVLSTTREMFQPAVGTRLLVIGGHPWMYFALSARPETYMIFMHLTGSDIAYRMLANRLSEKTPEAVIFAGPSTASIVETGRNLAALGSMHCVDVEVPRLYALSAFTIQTYYNMVTPVQMCIGSISAPRAR